MFQQGHEAPMLPGRPICGANDFAAGAPAPTDLLQQLCSPHIQWEWDIRQNQIALFSRRQDGRDQVEPSFNCTPDEWLASVDSGDRQSVKEKFLTLAASATRSFELQFRVSAPQGTPQWVDLHGLVVRDPAGKAVSITAYQTRLSGDNTPSHEPSPFHDPLTGLPNRRLFQRCLSNAVDSTRQQGSCGFALLFVDLDHFKAINDVHGHLAGDQTLVVVAQRIAHSVRPADVVARRDGDEFTILLRNIWHHADASAVADRILQQLRAPLSVGGAELAVTASIGIALNCADLVEPDELVHHADAAMYRAKAAGGDCHLTAGHDVSEGARP